jgi:hypothetical protein
MIKVDRRVAFINYTQEHKLPPGIDQKSTKATRILRRSKGYVLVGGNLYKRGSTSGILMKCVSMEEGKEILQEIHKGVCGNHAASRTLVGKAFRSGFYWSTALADAEALVCRCTNCQFFGKKPHVPAHNLITIPSHVVVVNHMVNFQPRELVLELAYLRNICVHGVLVDVPLLVDLLDYQ